MKYLGSKNRIAKFILPIMLQAAKDANINNWVEPFVGGGNMIDKVPKEFKRVGYDVNGHVIQALEDIRDEPQNLLDSFSFEQRKINKELPPQKYISHACIITSFGADLKGGYARDKTNRNYTSEGKRNALKQSPNIQNVDFICDDFLNLNFENSLIYCDPPYKGTTSYKTNPFPYNEFYNWCRKQKQNGNVIFVSEYEMPEDFTEVWRGEIKTNLASQRTKATHNAVEKLFKL